MNKIASPSRRFALGALAIAAAGVAAPRWAFAQGMAASAAGMTGSIPLPPASKSVEAARWLGRVAYGADAASLAQLLKVGKKAYLDEQLNMPAAEPPAVAQRIADMAVSRQSLLDTYAQMISDAQEVKAIKGNAQERQQARRTMRKEGMAFADQVRERHLLRAIYSPGQLREVMTWFWMNHFSIYDRKRDVRWTIGSMETDSVRPRVFGKFRDLLMATVTAPAMLSYLDNTQSSADKLNENYARELMELHTMGVSGGASGSNYTQKDVQELARVLTGLHVVKQMGASKREDLPGYKRMGIVAFDPKLHDSNPKVLLGQRIEPGGFDEIERAVTILAKQESTARFISTKMCNFFFGDHPPAAVIDAAAAQFKSSDGDIAAVLRVILLSSQLEDRLAKGPMEFKDPQQYVVSSVRLLMLRNTQPVVGARVVGWVESLSGKLFGRITPDGYPMEDDAWVSSGQMVKRFEIAQEIASGLGFVAVQAKRMKGGAKANANAQGMKQDRGGKAGPAQPSASPPTLDPTFYSQVIAPQLSKQTLATLAKASSDVERNALLLSSPEWMQR